MLRLDKVIKPWKESASLNDHINLSVTQVAEFTPAVRNWHIG
ncbi:MAG TPA: hypothetical protein VI386_10750 [Candidatus Sulfotelmatobacter sp.]